MKKLSNKEKNKYLTSLKQVENNSASTKEENVKTDSKKKKTKLQLFKDSLKHSWNPFYYEDNGTFDKKTKLFIKISSIVIAVILVGAIAINYSFNSSSGVRVAYKQHYKNQDNVTPVGSYKRDGKEYKILTYTDKKGFWAAEYSADVGKVTNKGLINNSTSATNPLIVMQLLKGLQDKKVTTDKSGFSMTKNGIKINDTTYQPIIEHSQVIGYTKNNNKKIYYFDTFYNNVTVQVAQQKLLQKHNIKLNDITLQDVSFVNGELNITFTYLIGTTSSNDSYLLVTHKNGRADLHYNN